MVATTAAIVTPKTINQTGRTLGPVQTHVEAAALRRQEAETDDLVEVKVDSIRVHLPTGQHVVILKEKTNDRYLPIWIGTFEANAIAMKIQGTAPERPITTI